MKRLEKDGEVAVLVSYGFGAGWSTWSEPEYALDGDIAQAVLDGDYGLALQIAEEKYPDAYTGGLSDCRVEWVRKGLSFEITEYDGSESLNIISEQSYQTA